MNTKNNVMDSVFEYCSSHRYFISNSVLPPNYIYTAISQRKDCFVVPDPPRIEQQKMQLILKIYSTLVIQG